jgi:hypothetical protein
MLHQLHIYIHKLDVIRLSYGSIWYIYIWRTLTLSPSKFRLFPFVLFLLLIHFFFFFYSRYPPGRYSVPRSLNGWPTKVVVEPSERIYYLSGPND